jgi:hypothetical protein
MKKWEMFVESDWELPDPQKKPGIWSVNNPYKRKQVQEEEDPDA